MIERSLPPPLSLPPPPPLPAPPPPPPPPPPPLMGMNRLHAAQADRELQPHVERVGLIVVELRCVFDVGIYLGVGEEASDCRELGQSHTAGRALGARRRMRSAAIKCAGVVSRRRRIHLRSFVRQLVFPHQIGPSLLATLLLLRAGPNTRAGAPRTAPACTMPLRSGHESCRIYADMTPSRGPAHPLAEERLKTQRNKLSKPRTAHSASARRPGALAKASGARGAVAMPAATPCGERQVNGAHLTAGCDCWPAPETERSRFTDEFAGPVV